MVAGNFTEFQGQLFSATLSIKINNKFLMRSPIGAFIFISFMLLLDGYVFQAVKAVSLSASPKTKAIIYGIYWCITIIAIIAIN